MTEVITMNDLTRRELEAECENLQDDVKELEDALHDAYVMLDRFSGDMTDEAYEEVEAILGNALEDNFAAESRIHELKGEAERLRDALSFLVDASRQMLRKNAPIDPRVWKRLASAATKGAKALEGGDDDA